MTKHVLYVTGDADAPASILDGNGDVVLGMCRVCGAAERELDRPCVVIHHPAHYGGADDPYEAIKVIEAWALNFNLGNAVKYIRRADFKGTKIADLRKAAWYINREIENLEARG